MMQQQQQMENNNSRYTAGYSQSQSQQAPVQSGSLVLPALNTLSPLVQQYVLMRDLLQVLSGIEGQYIRVAAASTSASASENYNPQQQYGQSSVKVRRGSGGGASTTGITGGSAGGSASILPKVSEATFLIDMDSADRSAANQVSLNEFVFVSCLCGHCDSFELTF